MVNESIMMIQNMRSFVKGEASYARVRPCTRLC
jgi:hypothetical protein